MSRGGSLSEGSLDQSLDQIEHLLVGDPVSVHHAVDGQPGERRLDGLEETVRIVMGEIGEVLVGSAANELLVTATELTQRRPQLGIGARSDKELDDCGVGRIDVGLPEQSEPRPESVLVGRDLVGLPG